MIREYGLDEIGQVKVHGRTTANRSPLALFWTGSGIELRVTGTELWVELESDFGVFEQWVSVIINGCPLARLMVPRGRTWICLFRGMKADKVKQVRIMKEVQPMPDDPESVLLVHGIRTDGSFLSVPDRPYKLEFVGDSITSGEGITGARSEEDWIPMFFSTIGHYAALTAETLNADFRIISQSGWGVVTGWNNDPRMSIPQYYGQICGVLKGERNRALGAWEPNDFAAWQPDAVIVNLGTNDGGAFHQPPWTDGESGQTHQMRLKEDGSYHEEDLFRFEEGVRRFLAKLRTNNPGAWIVWAYGMIGKPMMPSIHRAVDRYVKESGDRRVEVFGLPDMTDETAGARNHPGVLDHRLAAEALAGFLTGKLSSR